MSVSCDCEGVGAAPVVTPNIGIVASTDILAADQASVDLVYALKDSDHKDLVERIETRHGLRQLSYMKEMHMGNDRYHLINIDEDDKEILPADASQSVCSASFSMPNFPSVSGDKPEIVRYNKIE